MRKKLLVIALLSTITLGMTGCIDNNVININDVLESPNSKLIDFEIVDKNFYNVILVDKNTNVLYLWNTSSDGGITPIYNSDGTLKLYEED